MLKNLILTGGLYHAFEQSAATLAEVLREVSIASEITEDIDAGLEQLAQGDFDLLTVYALRWTMPQSKFAADRATHAYRLPASGRDAITSHLAAGRGLLALHTAAICFDDWPAWREIVGAGWTWGHSYHPPLGPVQVRPTGRAHPVVAGTTPFALSDEAYTDMPVAADLQPLLEVRAENQTRYSPCLWVREIGGGRVVYDALGHDSASLQAPQHKAIVQRAARWITGQL